MEEPRTVVLDASVMDARGMDPSIANPMDAGPTILSDSSTGAVDASADSARPTHAFLWSSDFAHADVAAAVASDEFLAREGPVTLVDSPAPPLGGRTLKVELYGGERIARLNIRMPGVVIHGDGLNNNPNTEFYHKWYERRPATFDWAGEKFNRYYGRLGSGNVTLDYPLGWTSNPFPPTTGTDGPGNIQMFANSIYSLGNNHGSAAYRTLPRDTWVEFQIHYKLNTVGSSDAEFDLWYKEPGAAPVHLMDLNNRRFRDAAYTIDEISLGGWWSSWGVPGPTPGPAVRYIANTRIDTAFIPWGS